MVNKILLTAVLFYFVDDAVSQCNVRNPICNAVEAPIEDFPYQVSIRNHHKHWCGGALINIGVVVTSASCLEGLDKSVVTIGASTISHTVGGITLQVSEIIRHPKYDRVTKDYDIALIKCNGDFNTLSPTFGFVKLINSKSNNWRYAVATGWGKITQAYVDFSDVLRQDYLPVTPQEECRKFYGSAVTDRMLCAGYRQGRVDSCVSDRGGPLVYNNTLIGVASWGNGCGKPTEPVVYTNIFQVQDFIKQYQ